MKQPQSSFNRHARNFITQSERCDLFGQPVPTFNLNRKTQITSQVGVFVSLIVIISVLVFMSVKAILLI